MATIKKNNNDVRGRDNSVTGTGFKSYENDPFFLKKLEEAKVAVKNLVLPDRKGK